MVINTEPTGTLLAGVLPNGFYLFVLMDEHDVPRAHFVLPRDVALHVINSEIPATALAFSDVPEYVEATQEPESDTAERPAWASD